MITQFENNMALSEKCYPLVVEFNQLLKKVGIDPDSNKLSVAYDILLNFAWFCGFKVYDVHCNVFKTITGNYGLAFINGPTREIYVGNGFGEKWLRIGLLAHELGHAYSAVKFSDWTELSAEFEGIQLAKRILGSDDFVKYIMNTNATFHASTGLYSYDTGTNPSFEYLKDFAEQRKIDWEDNAKHQILLKDEDTFKNTAEGLFELFKAS